MNAAGVQCPETVAEAVPECEATDSQSGNSEWKPEQFHELIENLEQLKKQNSSLRERVRYLESDRDKRIQKKSSNSSEKSSPTEESAKTKVSKWSKMKGALGWEMKGGGQEMMDSLKVPGSSSDHSSSFSPSPSESISVYGPLHPSSSSSEEDLIAVDGPELPDRPSEVDQDCCVSTEIEDKGNKSLDSTSPLLSSNKKVLKTPPKEHKTPWSKMKGIIHNTRVVGTKKRHSQDETDPRTEDKNQYEISGSQLNNLDDVEGMVEPFDNCQLSLPALTVTVPSLEELASHLPSSTGKGPSTSNAGMNHALRAPDDNCRQSNIKENNHSLEVSPPSQRKSSKWFKVKNVFLPSGHVVRTSNSAPCSPVRSDSFVYEVESDDISSGEYIDEPHKERYDNSYHEERANRGNRRSRSIQEEIQHNYHKLQQKLNEEFQRKVKEWDKVRNTRCGGSGFSSGNSSLGEETHSERIFRQRLENGDRFFNYKDPNNIQQRGEDNLSPDFKKKLEEWDRMKCGSPLIEQNDPFQNKKKNTAEGTGHQDHDHESKLLEWQCIKLTPFEFERTMDNRQQRRLFLAEKWRKGGRSPQENPSHKSIKRGTKELAWLEKELHKIEREKQRLEREKDKFLQREARLKKMRLAIGSGMRKQEVLIPTSTGTFRFQGISQKFTRKLFEWEMAQGIQPEASTFALLDPGYKLSLSSNPHNGGENGSLLVRSKSVGSVADLGGPSGTGETITHQQSSLSLNDMDTIEGGCLHVEEDVPEAIIVDLEDVSEATGLVPDSEIIRQTPVYCYAPEEVTRLIDSSGSENEDMKKNVACKQVVESSYQLLQENMCLLNKLKQERDACLKLEHDMEHLEGQISHVSKSFDNEFERLDSGMHSEHSVKERMNDIRTRIDELDHQKEALQFKEDSLKERLVEHSEQEAELAQSLVGNMRELQKAHYNMMTLNHRADRDTWKAKREKETLFSVVQELSTELLHMAERLELNLNARNKEIWRLRQINQNRRKNLSDYSLKGQFWTISSYTYPKRKDYSLGRYCNDEVLQLPTLLTNKIMELRKILGYLFGTADSSPCRKQDVRILDEDSEGGFLDCYRTVDSKELRSNSEYVHMQDKVRDNECSSPASSFTFQTNFQQEEGIHQRNSSVWEWEKLHTDKMIIEESQQNYEDDDNSTTLSRDDEKPSTPSFSDYDYYGNLDLKREGAYKPYREIINEDSSHDEDVSEIEADCHPPPLPPVPQDFRYYPSPSRIQLSDVRNDSFDEKNERYVPSPESTQCDEEESSSGCRSPDDQGNRTTAVNVFVPTTRKIFSPVYLDESGETSSVVEIVVKENADTIEGRDTTEDKINDNMSRGQWQGRPVLAFRERAHSASPSVLRRQRRSSFTRDSPKNGRRHVSCTKLNPSSNIGRTDEVTVESESTVSCSPYSNTLDKTLEEAEQEITNKKLDVGFPPISPIYARKEMRQLNKDTPGIRMIARYNKKTEEETADSGSSSSIGWRSPLSQWMAGDKRYNYRQEIRGVIGERTVSVGAIQRDRDRVESKTTPGNSAHTITKSSSVGAIRFCLDRLASREIDRETVSINGRETELNGLRVENSPEKTEKIDTPKSLVIQDIEDGVPTPESLRLRALKLKKAKEEFLQRGLDQNKLPPWQEDAETVESASIVVSEERLNELTDVLVVKSPLEVMSDSGHVAQENVESTNSREANPKPSGFAARFKWFKSTNKNHKTDGSRKLLETVSILCRQSLHVDIGPSRDQLEENPVRSCPSSPVLPRPSRNPEQESSSSSHWIRNPAKLFFRPKGKYTINNNK